MSLLRPRILLRPLHLRPALTLPAAARATFHCTPLTRASAGYGDPQDEKIANETPTPHATKDAGGHSVAGHGGGGGGKPASAADPQPGGKGAKAGEKGGTTDPEVGSGSGSGGGGKKAKSGGKGKVGSAGGKEGAGAGGDKHVSDKEIRETKKIGEEPKKEEVGGAGVIGG